MNAFLNQLTKKNTYTENGAISNSSTGSFLLNQFATAATYRGRNQDVVNNDMVEIWNENPELAMKFLFYLRMVTRQNKGILKTEKVQTGQGVRDEFFKRMWWVAKYHPKTFLSNLYLIPETGSWKDLITLWEKDPYGSVEMQHILEVFDYVNYKTADSNETVANAARYHLENIKKYIPTLRSKQKNDHQRKMRQFANAFMEHYGMTEKEYRAYKASGISHKFQRDICGKNFEQLNFSAIGGRFIGRLTSTKKGKQSFIEKWGLEGRYMAWLEGTSTVKFTGYPYELLSPARSTSNKIEEFTLNKQFDHLLATAKKNGAIKGNVWCALDTSCSMGTKVTDKVSAFDICISLGIFFSSLNEGAFKDQVIMFDDRSYVKKLSGTFVQKVKAICREQTAWGSTNFQSVIDEIVRVRMQNPNIPVSDFPETLLVVSDMEFNPSGSNSTNYEVAMQKLRAVGLPEINIIWWNVCSRNKQFPSTMDDKGTVLISGFDGSIVSLLLNGEQKTSEGKAQLDPMEAMLKALNQELLLNVVI